MKKSLIRKYPITRKNSINRKNFIRVTLPPFLPFYSISRQEFTPRVDGRLFSWMGSSMLLLRLLNSSISIALCAIWRSVCLSNHTGCNFWASFHHAEVCVFSKPMVILKEKLHLIKRNPKLTLSLFKSCLNTWGPYCHLI